VNFKSKPQPPSNSPLLFRDDPLGAAVADLKRRRLLKGAGALLAGAATPFAFTGHAWATTETTPITPDGAKRGGTLTAVLHPEPPTLAFFVNSATMIGAVASKIFDAWPVVPSAQLNSNEPPTDTMSVTLVPRTETEL